MNTLPPLSPQYIEDTVFFHLPKPFSRDNFERMLNEFRTKIRETEPVIENAPPTSFKMMYDWGWTFLADWDTQDESDWSRDRVYDYLTIHTLCVDLERDAHKQHHKDIENLTNEQLWKTRKDVERELLSNPELVTAMKAVWPNLKHNRSSLKFWCDRYIKHGYLSGLSPKEYFQLAVILHQSFIYRLYINSNVTMNMGDFATLMSNQLRGHIPQLKVCDSEDIRNFNANEKPCAVLKGVNVKFNANLQIESYEPIMQQEVVKDYSRIEQPFRDFVWRYPPAANQ